MRDVAEVAYKSFFDPEMVGQSYALTGGAAFTYGEAAEIFTRVLQKPVRYRNASPLSFLWRNFEKSGNFTLALVMTAIYTTARFGKAARVTDEVKALLGREPITLEQFVWDYAEVWR